MRLIRITPIVKKRVTQMILGLIPNVGYVKVTNRGLVILKAKRWSWRKTIVPITDLCIHEIPKRIAEIAVSKGLGENHVTKFNEHITAIMQLQLYNDRDDLFEYIWNQYVITCMEVHIVLEPNKILAIQAKRTQRLNSFRLLNTDYVYGVGDTVKRAVTKLQTNKVYKQIQKIKDRLPKLPRLPNFSRGFEV